MPVYFSTYDSVTIYGDGNGFIVFKQYAASDGKLVGEVRMPREQFAILENHRSHLEDEAVNAPENIDELEGE